MAVGDEEVPERAPTKIVTKSGSYPQQEQQLVEMGFELKQVRLALLKSDGEVEQAMEFILSGNILEDAAPAAGPEPPAYTSPENVTEDQLAETVPQEHDEGATVRSSSNDSTSVQTGDDKDAPQEFTCNRVDGAIEFFSSETNGLNNMTGDRRHGTKRAPTDIDVDVVEISEISPPRTRSRTSQKLKEQGPPPGYDSVIGDSTPPIPPRQRGRADAAELRRLKAEEYWRIPDDGMYRFPATPMNELETSVYKTKWSLPIERYESLEVCMQAATLLAGMPHFATDEACQRFLSGSLPHAMEKVMDAVELRNWATEVHTSLYFLVQLHIKMSIALIPYDHKMTMEHLEKIFTDTSNFHIVNRTKQSRLVHESPGDIDISLITVQTGYQEFCWLKDFIYFFVINGGVETMQRRLVSEPAITGETLALLLKPIGQAHKHLTADGKMLFQTVCQHAMEYIRGLEPSELSSKDYAAISEVLTVIKNLAPSEEKRIEVHQYRMRMAERLLDNSTFNSKMNGLFEVTKFGKDAAPYLRDPWLTHSRVLEWMREQQVLKKALQGFLHLDGYVKRIEDVVQYMVRHGDLNEDDLMALWTGQADAHDAAVRNIHNLIKALAYDLNQNQQTQLLGCFKRSWLAAKGDEKVKGELLEFIKNLAKDGREAHLPNEVLKLLWDFIHDPHQPATTVNLALDAFFSVMTAWYQGESPDKKVWIERFIDDVREGKLVVPALKLIRKLINEYQEYNRYSYSSSAELRMTVLLELERTQKFLATICASCVRCCGSNADEAANAALIQDLLKRPESVAASEASENAVFDSDTPIQQVVDRVPEKGSASGSVTTTPERPFVKKSIALDDARPLSNSSRSSVSDNAVAVYSHDELLNEHLALIKYVLAAEDTQLPDNLCFMLWAMIDRPVQSADQDVLYSWFQEIIEDHIHDKTKIELLECRMLGKDPVRLSPQGFRCFRELFIHVNITAGKLTGTERHYHIRQLHLTGTEYLWSAALLSANADVSSAAVELLLGVFGDIPRRLADDRLWFVEECFKRLRDDMPLECKQRLDEAIAAPSVEVQDEGSILERVHSAGSATITLDESAGAELSLRRVRRLLEVLEGLVRVQQARQPISVQRDEAPFYVAGVGKPLTLRVTVNHLSLKKTFFLHTHTNVPLMVVRKEIAYMIPCDLTKNQLKLIFVGEKSSKKHGTLRLCEFGLDGGFGRPVQVNATYYTRYSTTIYSEEEYENENAAPKPDVGSSAPFVLLSQNSAYMQELFNLADCDDTEVRNRASALLHRLPTDRACINQLDDVLGGGLQRKLMLASVIPFDVLPAFRLSYRIKALSHTLMPSIEHTSKEAIALRRTFIHGGGIDFLVNVLQCERLRSSTFETARLDCYGAITRLLRYLLSEAFQLEPWNIQSSAAAEYTVVDFEFEVDLKSGIDQLRQEPCLNIFTDGGLGVWPLDKEGADEAVNVGPSIFDTRQLITVLFDLFMTLTEGCKSVAKEHVDECTTTAKFALELVGNLISQFPENVTHILEHPNFGNICTSVIVASESQVLRISTARLVLHIAMLPPTTPGWLEKILSIFMKTRLPFWSHGPMRLEALSRAPYVLEYFRVLAKLLVMLNSSGRGGLLLSTMPDFQSRVDAEVSWLVELCEDFDDVAVLPTTDSIAFQDLICGHLVYLRALLRVGPASSRRDLDGLVLRLLDRFLFRASARLFNVSDGGGESELPFKPICSTKGSRAAAIALAIELRDSAMPQICRTLSLWQNSSMGVSWNYKPITELRSTAGYVGLKNAGCTCYMNATLQQLYMNETVRKAVLSLDDEDESKWQAQKAADAAVDAAPNAPPLSKKNSTFFEMQRIFASLMLSDTQHFTPEGFWQTYRLFGEQVNVRVQQDAQEFYSNLVDQVDEHLKAAGQPKALEREFGGLIADQKLCKCDCYYEREEVFSHLTVDVKNNDDLHEGLEQFTKGEWLKGDNQYKCERCDKKVDTLKRQCIKKLPPTLVIHLKRFGYDWDRLEAIKYNDRFEFPELLDMEPYTAAGISRREAQDRGNAAEALPPPEETQYRLSGAVVHSGIANAGHYYSYSRNPSYKSGEWIKFNDHEVDTCQLGPAEIEHELYGGKYTVHNPMYPSYPDERERSWNAYLLFYERVVSDEDCEGPTAAQGDCTADESAALQQSSPDELARVDSLLHRGKQAFAGVVPFSIAREVHKSNIKFVHERTVFGGEYFGFIADLVQPPHAEFSCDSMKAMSTMFAQFLLNVYLRVHESIRDQRDITNAIEVLFRGSATACEAFAAAIVAEQGAVGTFLLTCPEKLIRASFGKVLSVLMRFAGLHGILRTTAIRDLLREVFGLLRVEVPRAESSEEYLAFFSGLFQNGIDYHIELIEIAEVNHCFRRIQDAVLPLVRGDMSSAEERFDALFSSLAAMVLAYDLRSLQKGGKVSDDPSARSHPAIEIMQNRRAVLPLSPDVRVMLETQSQAVISALVCAVHIDAATIAAEYLAWENAPISDMLIIELLGKLASINKLKHVIVAFERILSLNDSLQGNRISLFLEGTASAKGFLQLTDEHKESNPRKTYLLIKSFVELSRQIGALGAAIQQGQLEEQLQWLDSNLRIGRSMPQESNEDDEDNRFFLRTNSATETLMRARDLYRPRERNDQHPLDDGVDHDDVFDGPGVML